MARLTHKPAETPIPDDLTLASGTAPCPNARHVDLVWHDPVSGERLTLGLDASPALIANLREDGFEVAGSNTGGSSPDGQGPDGSGGSDGSDGSGGSGSSAAA